MTREEAIANLNMISVAFVEPVTKEQRELINKTFDMAIKALEQEPCEDCISREWIKTAIHNFYNGLMHVPTEEDIQAYLDVAPSVQPKTDWIPVSERLPEKSVWVLVTVEQSGNRHQEIMRRNKYIEAWSDSIDNYTDVITAWMPLPEPYKEEGSGEE